MLHTYRLYLSLLKNINPYYPNNCKLQPLKCLIPKTRSYSSYNIESSDNTLDSTIYSDTNVPNTPLESETSEINNNRSQTGYRKFGLDKGVSSNKRSKLTDVEECLVEAEINGIGSPFSAMCWHKGPYSNYFNQSSTNSGDSSNDDYNYRNSTDSTVQQNQMFPEPDMIGEMEHLLSVERKEKDRMRLFLERNRPLKIDEHIRDKQLASKVSTLKLISISKQIASRPPSSAKPQLDINKYLKEKRYQKLLYKDKDTNRESRDKQNKKRKDTYTSESSIETIRILDIDRLPLPILHHMLCYTLVKNVPAENVLKLISNIASLRDKNKHICYQNIFKQAMLNTSPVCAAEIVATLTRCYQSISIPFMVDYVRRYGTFSRKFLSNLINRYSKPLPLDFFRYESHSRNLPVILTRPRSLLGFVNLLKNSSAKRYMYLNLLNYGYVPNLQKFDKIHAYGTMDYELSGEILSFEKLLDDNILISDNKEDPNRPKIYDKILELQYTGDTNLEDLELTNDTSYKSNYVDKTEIETKFVNNDIVNEDNMNDPEIENEFGVKVKEGIKYDSKYKTEPTPTSVQFIKVLSQQELKDSSSSNDDNKKYRDGYKDVDEGLPTDGSNISWTVPWGLKRNVFHYRGKTYKLDQIKGWISVKSNVRINYLKNVKMNKRKRDRKLIRRRATKQAKLRILNNL